MRGIIRLAITTGLLLLGAALAQNSQATHENYQWNTTKQVTVRGTVLDVREYQCPVSGTIGTHLTLKQDSGPIEVHLAPAKFVKDYEIVIQKGDQVEIQAAKIEFEGKPALLAKVVSMNNVTYQIRDGNGKPLW